MTDGTTDRPGLVADNLVYSGSAFGPPSLVVFPKSRRGEELWGDLNLWESEFVVAHELGHHVLTTLVQSSGNAAIAAAVAEPAPYLGRRIGGAAERAAEAMTDDGTQSVLKALAPINEAFADLYAQISLSSRLPPQASPASRIQGLRCLEGDRDPTRAAFADGSAKALTGGAFSAYLYPSDDSSSGEPCGAPDFADAHVVGAVVAHALYALLTDGDAGAWSEELTTWQARRLFYWAEAIGQLQQASAETLLESMLRLGVSSMLDGAATPAQCDIVAQAFPVQYPSWRALVPGLQSCQ
jgi:hypothetical protein